MGWTKESSKEARIWVSVTVLKKGDGDGKRIGRYGRGGTDGMR